MTNMDAYTILYQAKERILEDNQLQMIIKEKSGGNVQNFMETITDDAEVIRQIALEGLEEGINRIRYEFPPNVSKRMQQYYQTNKEVLIDTFSNKVREVIKDRYQQV